MNMSRQKGEKDQDHAMYSGTVHMLAWKRVESAETLNFVWLVSEDASKKAPYLRWGKFDPARTATLGL
jgi:hypothetical protein